MVRILIPASGFVLLLLLLGTVLGEGPTLGLNSSASQIINAPANTVWLTYPDYNTTHPKPSGVGYPDFDSFSMYTFSYGVILGMSAHPQQETIDTNAALFDRSTGAPIVSGRSFVFMAGPSIEAQMAYYESNRIAPVYLSNDPSNIFWVSRNGTMIRETITPRSSLTGSMDLFLLEVFSDSKSNYVFTAYGLTVKGSMAAAVIYKVIFPQLSTYQEGWYIYRWTDRNGNGVPDLQDSYTVIVSQSDYPPNPIPEFGNNGPLTATLVVGVLTSFLAVRSIRSRGRHYD